MIYGSVCSGIEAATVAWHPLGFSPLFFSEIEKFPCQLLKHYYSGIPNLGDMTKTEVFNSYGGKLDILVGGTPCQSFSIAGLRKGLDDPRGNLALTFLRVVEITRPRWVLWENVFGVLSSKQGKDFGSFITALGQLGYGFAYRVYDAKYFGVPQRRRRVFVIGYIGDWRRAAAVLFESSCLSGNNIPSKEVWQNNPSRIAKCLTSRCTQKLDANDEDMIIAKSINSYSGGNQVESNYIPVHVMRTDQQNSNGHCFSENISGTLDGSNGQAIAYRTTGNNGVHLQGNKTSCLNTNTDTTQQIIHSNIGVRRLTPEECERLQGFPTGYTKINSKIADGTRYKAIGNSMAIPVMRYIGERIQIVDQL